MDRTVASQERPSDRRAGCALEWLHHVLVLGSQGGSESLDVWRGGLDALQLAVPSSERVGDRTNPH